MWQGVIIGLLLGVASIPNLGLFGLILFAVLGGVIGKIARSEGASDAKSVSPAELLVLREQMRQTKLRLDQLETWLREAGIIPERVAGPQAAAQEAKPVELKPVEPAPILVRASKTESPPAVETKQLQAEAPPPRQPVEESRPHVSYQASAAISDDKSDEPQTLEVPAWLSEFVARWITGGNPIVKVGGLVLFLGLAFLLRYVTENTVVPVEFRYAGVAASGIALLLLGWRLRDREDSYGLILQGAGVGVLYLTTLAGMKLHPLIPAEAGFAIFIGVAVFTVLLAVLQDSLALAAAASLGGFAAPVLASTGGGSHVALFSYLTLLNLAIVAIAWFKAWRLLNLIGFFCTLSLAVAWGERSYQPEMFNTVEPFLLLFFLLYVLIAFLFARRALAEAPETLGVSFEDYVRQTAPKVSYVDGSLVFGAPIATFSMQYLIIRGFENGPAFSALGFGLAYIFLAYALFRRTGARYALLNETMIALAVIFGTLAIPLALEGKWTSAAWAVEAAGVYWVGIRQQRVHARLFALLLLFGSAGYFVLALSLRPDIAALDGPVLDGSWLGCLMLASSTWWFYHLGRQAPDGVLHAFERHMRPALVAGGCLFVALTPFLLLPMNWASTLLAVLGAAAVFAARPLTERHLIGWGCAYQVLAGALYLTTLHPADGDAVLAESWRGLVMAGLIGVSLLAAVWGSLRQQEGEGEEQDASGGLLPLILLGGLFFVNLAPLFVLPWRFAVMVWPITGVATLWWALRFRQRAALAFALGLQLIAGYVYLGVSLSFYGPDMTSDARPFLHSGFWSPLLIALAAFAAARLLHRREGEWSSQALGWVALVWSGVWWAFAWGIECERLLTPETPEALAPCLIALAAVTAGVWRTLARAWNWPQLGQATLAYLPVLALLLTLQMEAGAGHPLSHWAALSWLAALVMHVVLLRDQKDWLAPELHAAAHVVGVWLFVVIAGFEAHWRLATWSDAQGAWSMLGWLLAPVAYLWTVSSEAPRKRWPIRDFREAYVVTAASPVAVFVLGWAWQSAFMGDSAAPLPYAPLLNPLESGQIAVLLGIALWRRSLQQSMVGETGAILGGVFDFILGVTAFAAITGTVMRVCHQWAAIPWRTDALLQSMIVQTSLSIVWGVIAIGLMLAGHGLGLRRLWIAGAALIAVVVGKLFFVELAAHGSLERIVSFIAVGLLLLLVGYFAPLPPRRDAEPREELEHPTASEAS
jgi:uncharacterized membrane protein